MLCEWADYIVCMESHMESYIDQRYKSKLRAVDVGPDVWGVHIAPDLLAKVRLGAKEKLGV